QIEVAARLHRYDQPHRLSWIRLRLRIASCASPDYGSQCNELPEPFENHHWTHTDSPLKDLDCRRAADFHVRTVHAGGGKWHCDVAISVERDQTACSAKRFQAAADH